MAKDYQIERLVMFSHYIILQISVEFNIYTYYVAGPKQNRKMNNRKN